MNAQIMDWNIFRNARKKDPAVSHQRKMKLEAIAGQIGEEPKDGALGSPSNE
jgi:hypothetical protein